jgi:hypothetical protein
MALADDVIDLVVKLMAIRTTGEAARPVPPTVQALGTGKGVKASGKLEKGGRDSNSETFLRDPAGERIPPGRA